MHSLCNCSHTPAFRGAHANFTANGTSIPCRPLHQRSVRARRGHAHTQGAPRPTTANRGAAATPSAVSTHVDGDVAVQLDKVSFSSRKLLASVSIAAPLDVVWGALTDYDGLGTFIPSLAENRCLERRPHGALLYQVGAQEVALGVKFCAATTLECIEYIDGISAGMCTRGLEGLGALFPWPTNSLPGRAARDISFAQLRGDFNVFKGVWRMQQGLAGSESTHLAYALYVQPQPWLPVGLIQNRITREVVNNLQAVRGYSERVHREQCRRLTGA